MIKELRSISSNPPLQTGITPREEKLHLELETGCWAQENSHDGLNKVDQTALIGSLEGQS